MISKHPNTQKLEAEMNLKLVDSMFIGVFLSWISLNFIDNAINSFVTIILSILILLRAFGMQKRALAKLDKLEEKLERIT